MARQESSYASKDAGIIYPEVVNQSRTSGLVQNLKGTALTGLTNTSFYFDIPSIVHLQGATATTTLGAYQNLVTTLVTYQGGNPLVEIKLLKTILLQWAASSYSYIGIYSIFRI